MSTSTREKLALQQSALVAALAGHEPIPDGFDAARIQVAAEVLAGKRRRAVAKTWPSLTQALGDSFIPSFESFAAALPLPADGGALADGRNFARWLAERNQLPDAGRLETLMFDLSDARRAWPKIKVTWLRDSRRLAVGLRLPWIGVRSVSIPVGLFRRS